MADIQKAIGFVMRQEDSTLSGAITDAPNDRGGLTRFGLTARWHPELVTEGFFAIAAVDNGKLIPRMKASAAFAMAEQAYASEYVDTLGLRTIADQALATALLSFAVLEGAAQAVTLFQKAIVAVTPPLSAPKAWNNTPAPSVLGVDGLIGPKTLALANAADAGKLRVTFVAFCEAYFEHLAQVVPAQAANLPGWRNRAKELLALDAATTPEPTPEPTPAQPATA